jgi:hypothetical protein
VTAAFVAWTAASSGCEQMFSHLKRSPAELASSRGDTDRRLAVIIGSDPQFDNEIVERAQKLYGKLLRSGRARTSKRQPRLDCRRVGAEKPESKKSWIRARKKAVDAAAQEQADIRTPERRPPLELPESLAKEVAKQKDLEKKRKAEAFLEGSLLDSEEPMCVWKPKKDRKQKKQMTGTDTKSMSQLQLQSNWLRSLKADSGPFKTCPK